MAQGEDRQESEDRVVLHDNYEAIHRPALAAMGHIDQTPGERNRQR